MALTTTFHDQTVAVGDTIRVSQKIREGEKERIQHFQGVVIAIKGNSGERSVVVRKIATGGIGVERLFPVDLPSISSVTVGRQANVSRAKLYFLRQRGGKSSLLLEERETAVTHVDERTRTPGRERRARLPHQEAVSSS